MTGVFEHLGRLTKDLFIYGLSNIGNTFAGILLLPIYTRVFSPEEYGVIEIILSTQALLSAIVSLQIASGTARYYYETTGRQRQILISSGLLLLLPLATLTALGGFIWRVQISQLLFSSPVYGTPISLALCIVLLTTISGYQLLIFRFRRESVKYSVLAVGNVVLSALLSIFFVIYMDKGVEGVFLGTLISSIAVNIVAFLLNRKFLTFAFSRIHAKDILAYGIPLTPTGIVGWFRNYINRFLLLPLIGLGGVGIFSSAIRISSVILLVVSSFRLAWTPFAMSLIHDENHKIIYSKVMTYLTAFLTTVAIVIVIFSNEIVHILMPDTYWKAITYIGPLALALVLDGMFNVAGISLGIVKKTYLNTAAFLIGVIIGIISLFILVPYIGIMGATIATLLSSAAALVSELYFAQRNYHIDYEIKKLLSINSLLLVAIPLTILIDEITNTPLRVGCKLVELGFLFLGLWKCMPPGELSSGLSLLKQKAAGTIIPIFKSRDQT